MIREPLTVGALKIKNRLVMPPMATYLCSEDGKVTDELLSYYSERAAGGNIGLIITEHSFFTRQGKAREKQLSISDDSDIEGLKRLTDVIHQNGTKAMVQLNHAGAGAPYSATGMPAVAPSPVILPVKPMVGDGTVPDELSKAQIARIVEEYAKAAVRAREAGYDGVEIHSAHAYLLNQFYSPLTNVRSDEYGGSLENRLRIHAEVIQAVRRAVGEDYTIAVRLGGADYMDGGNTFADSAEAAAFLEKAGVDMIDVSGGMCRYTRVGHSEPGYFHETAAAVRKAVSIPVVLTGGIKTIEDAEKFLATGEADLIGVGRELMKDPHWADKAIPDVSK